MQRELVKGVSNVCSEQCACVHPERLDDVTGDVHESWKDDALALAHVAVTSDMDMRKSQVNLCLQDLPDGCWRSG